MPINNGIYFSESNGWWEENHFLHLLKTGINPARFGYFHEVLIGTLSLDPAKLALLDVGCGGGVLSEEFARIGCQVTGIDPSGPSLEAAKRHAVQSGLEIDYREARGEEIPFEDESFEVVVCCDVLEHVSDPEKVIGEAARVLKPGGILCYDTINRTVASRRENIFAAQQFPLTRFFPPDTHVWEKFITPEELLGIFGRSGLENRGMTGLQAGIPDWQVAGLLIQRKLGLLDYAELGRQLKFTARGGLEASYLGWAMKKVP